MDAAVRQAFIGAGANLGDREATLRGAMARLRGMPGIRSVVSSPWYETDPVGVTAQPRFINLVLGVETTLRPEELLHAAVAIEREFGRVRDARWGPRTLDLDLLAYEGEMRDSPQLQLPHPRMLERRFVVAPLQDLLARPEFARPCWEDLRAALTGARPEGRVTRLVE